MADDSHRSWTTAYIVLPLLFVVAVASLLPLIETNVWWIRYFDYLRIQFTVALVVLLLLHLALLTFAMSQRSRIDSKPRVWSLVIWKRQRRR